ncbi:NAD-dependent protein deacetylase sirtuin-3, mitochondrial isoform X4 [Melanerpes formicivorus]|uniref:NAD-dependent protein deacetylase sirtuin-3, mitochondrial isoform X4 n=1 Tax=Melanerpes formicivorus TaxID=211600 RepID=UPI00358EFBDA
MERGARLLAAALCFPAAWRSLWEHGPRAGSSSWLCCGDSRGAAGPAAHRPAGARPLLLRAGGGAAPGAGGGRQRQLSLREVAEQLRRLERRRVVVMAGAGISTPSGIPDFRSPGSGLYSNLAQYDIPYPEAIFELMYFFANPKPFFTLAKELYPGNYRPNYAHYFLRLLHDKGLLLRLYTQNIDGLERGWWKPTAPLPLPPAQSVEGSSRERTSGGTSWPAGCPSAPPAAAWSSLTSSSSARSCPSASCCTWQTSPWQSCSWSLAPPWRWSPLPAWQEPWAAPCPGC